MSIGENIKGLREEHGLSQLELAKIIGVTDKSVSAWELDTNIPRMGAIQKMADYFGVPKSAIIEDKEESKNDTEIHTIAAHAIGKLNDEDVEEILRLAKYLLSKYKD